MVGVGVGRELLWILHLTPISRISLKERNRCKMAHGFGPFTPWFGSKHLVVDEDSDMHV